MKILHYTLGFPPARTGGLVTYVKRLLEEQVKLEYDVSVIYPGNQLFFGKKNSVVFKKTIGNIRFFELINSLPMALFGGIIDPKKFMVPGDKEYYREFLIKEEIQLIHIHTLIGLHKEFLEAARDLKISIVFTTHDYYGLSPLPNFFYGQQSYHQRLDNYSWNIMSHDALPIWKLRLFQHRLYPTIRLILKKINQNPKHVSPIDVDQIQSVINYRDLIKYYQDMFSLVDFFHFNSTIAQKVYCQHLGKLKGKVVRMTTTNDKETELSLVVKEIKTIAYIGPDELYKGYFDFLYLADKLKNEFNFVTYGHLPNQFAPEFIEQRGRYNQNQLSDVYRDIDLLIVPSLWQETFGLIILESLSQGVPVLARSNIGASECLPEQFIFSSIDDIPKCLEEISLIKDFGFVRIPNFSEHISEITKMYGELVYGK